MTEEEARRRLAARSGPIRLDLSDLPPTTTGAPRPRRELVRGAGPGRVGLSFRLVGLLVLVVGAETAPWWLQDHLPDAFRTAAMALVAAVAVGCFVYLEINRRRRRPRLLP